ncbi:hypothetical protein HBH91_015740 [Parastagonospora nodorum]|nr:hypothetical protein HBH91_015740 [Parastagonospora nodorum]
MMVYVAKQAGHSLLWSAIELKTKRLSKTKIMKATHVCPQAPFRGSGHYDGFKPDPETEFVDEFKRLAEHQA